MVSIHHNSVFWKIAETALTDPSDRSGAFIPYSSHGSVFAKPKWPVDARLNNLVEISSLNVSLDVEFSSPAEINELYVTKSSNKNMQETDKEVSFVVSCPDCHCGTNLR